MGIRLRLTLILMGAALVLATFTYPLWRPEPRASLGEDLTFPEITSAQRDALQDLPIIEQRAYLTIRQMNIPMAVDLVTARLRPPQALPEDQQALPPVENAVIVTSGEFAPIELPADETEREPQPYAFLYDDTVGNVTIYQFPDNRKFLRIEELGVISGPNLHVYLSSVADPVNSAEFLQDINRLDLGLLPANVGSMNITIPLEANISQYNSVIIYDNTYGIIFGVAGI